MKSRRPPLQDRSARPSGGARPGERAGAARRGVARICARQFRRAARNWSKAASSPRTPTIRGRARCIRPRRRWWSTARRSRRRSSISDIRRSARLSPAGSGATRRRKARWSVRRAGRSTRWSSSTRSMSRSTRASRSWRRSPRRGPPARSRPRSRLPARRAHVRKGELTFLDNVVDKATGTIAARVTIANPRLRLAARPVCAGAAAHQGRARRAHGADGGARLEPDGQIRLCRRRGRQGRAAAPHARANGWRACQRGQGAEAKGIASSSATCRRSDPARRSSLCLCLRSRRAVLEPNWISQLSRTRGWRVQTELAGRHFESVSSDSEWLAAPFWINRLTANAAPRDVVRASPNAPWISRIAFRPWMGRKTSPTKGIYSGRAKRFVSHLGSVSPWNHWGAKWGISLDRLFSMTWPPFRFVRIAKAQFGPTRNGSSRCRSILENSNRRSLLRQEKVDCPADRSKGSPPCGRESIVEWSHSQLLLVLKRGP